MVSNQRKNERIGVDIMDNYKQEVEMANSIVIKMTLITLLYVVYAALKIGALIWL